MTLRPFSQTLQQQFRDTLGTPGAPDVIDDATPVQAVAVVATVNTATSAGYTQVTDGTDTLAVNSNGSINVQVTPLPNGGSYVSAIAEGVNTGATVYTVTAGKTFYCIHATWGGTTANLTRLAVAGTNKLSDFNSAGLLCKAEGEYVLVATAGQAITIVHASGAGNGYACVVGYEV